MNTNDKKPKLKETSDEFCPVETDDKLWWKTTHY